eukprot:Anaeramoba_flamelloidesa92392_39.p1 GENE.a92392_39~~a92392_39.p1  ORF type:complete len:222 (+),score=-5.42 a92392_39:841-1506(+)
MSKKLYMVSLGPGDHELITIKALKALQNADAIVVPTKSSDDSFRRSMTHKIVSKLMDEFGFEKPLIPMYSPMQFKAEDWQRQANIIVDSLKEYDNISFVTLGDSGVYSSIYYLYELFSSQIQEYTEVIPGVTSFSQASALVKKPICLGDSGFEVIPLIGKEVPKTTVYMRPKVGFDTSEIDEQGEIFTFENLNYKNQNIIDGKKSVVERYMTLFIDFFKSK